MPILDQFLLHSFLNHLERKADALNPPPVRAVAPPAAPPRPPSVRGVAVRRARTRARARLLGEFLALDATQAQTFGIEDTGKSVALAVGERMLVRLPTAAGTGYGWHLAFGADLGPLALVRQTTEGNRARRGGDVLEVFVLEARAVGEARLEFGLYAPYPSAPIETVVLIVVVTP